MGDKEDVNFSCLTQLFSRDQMPLLRTDFSSDTAWEEVLNAVLSESDFIGNGQRYTPNVEAISDPIFNLATVDWLGSNWTDEYPLYAILADKRSMLEQNAGGEVTVVFVNLGTDDDNFGQAFRCVVSEVASVEANLAIANMDFFEFADAVGSDGVFRGF